MPRSIHVIANPFHFTITFGYISHYTWIYIPIYTNTCLCPPNLSLPSLCLYCSTDISLYTPFLVYPLLPMFISNPAALRQKFFNYSGCTIRDKHTLIVCGGIDSTLRNISNQVFEYDFRTNDMRMLRPMNQIRYTFPIIYHDNYIYAVGGRIYGPDNRSPFFPINTNISMSTSIDLYLFQSEI